MQLSSLVVCVSLVLPAPDGPDAERQRLIGVLMAEDRWAEASEEAERLIAGDVEIPDLAVVAGNLRMAAGHHAHAWRHYERALDRADTSVDGREAAQERLVRLVGSTRVIEVRVTPAVVGTTLVARRVDSRPPPDLERAVVDGVAGVRLDQGTWELLVEAPEFRPVRRVVGPEVAGVVALTMQPFVPVVVPPQPQPQPPSAKARVPGALVAGAVLVPLGLAALAGTFAGLPAHGRTGAAFDRRVDELTTRVCTADDVAALRQLADAARRQEGLIIGLGVTAGVLTTVGAVLLARGLHRRRQLHLDARPGVFMLGLSGRF